MEGPHRQRGWGVFSGNVRILTVTASSQNIVWKVGEPDNNWVFAVETRIGEVCSYKGYPLGLLKEGVWETMFLVGGRVGKLPDSVQRPTVKMPIGPNYSTSDRQLPGPSNYDNQWSNLAKDR